MPDPSPLTRLLDLLEPATDAFATLRADGYSCDLSCYPESHASEHAAVLAPELLDRIAALRAELWLDARSTTMHVQ